MVLNGEHHNNSQYEFVTGWAIIGTIPGGAAHLEQGNLNEDLKICNARTDQSCEFAAVASTATHQELYASKKMQPGTTA